MPKLTKDVVTQAKCGAKELILWDSELKGFGLRVKPTGVKTFIVQYRTGQGRKWPTKRVTIGQFGTITPDEARRAARAELAKVVLGNDPRAERDAAAKALTVAELCDEYLRAAALGSLVTRRGRTKAESTLEIDRGRIKRHIKPLVGAIRARDLTRKDVRKMFEAVASGETATDERTGKARGRARVSGGAGTAKKAVTLLRAVLTFGMRERHLAENVAADLPLPADGRRVVENPEQLFRDVGSALALAESRGEVWQATHLIRLLALSGMRREEAVGLDWSEVDFRERILRLRDGKTGDSFRPMSAAVRSLLWKIRVSLSAPDPLAGPVFPAVRRGNGAFGGLPGAWRRIISAEDLDERVCQRLAFTPHHLRHAVVTLANRMGISDATAGKIVGHQSETTTSRYIHHAMDEALLSVADRLADRIESLLKAGEQSHTAQMATKELRAAGRAEPFELEDFEDEELATIIALRKS